MKRLIPLLSFLLIMASAFGANTELTHLGLFTTDAIGDSYFNTYLLGSAMLLAVYPITLFIFNNKISDATKLKVEVLLALSWIVLFALILLFMFIFEGYGLTFVKLVDHSYTTASLLLAYIVMLLLALLAPLGISWWKWDIFKKMLILSVLLLLILTIPAMTMSSSTLPLLIPLIGLFLGIVVLVTTKAKITQWIKKQQD